MGSYIRNCLSMHRGRHHGRLGLEPFLGVIRHLGYPDYFMTILGPSYVLAGLTLLAPGVPRLKEWAYAGLVFNYTGAALSHLAARDGSETLHRANHFRHPHHGLLESAFAKSPRPFCTKPIDGALTLFEPITTCCIARADLLPEVHL